MKQAILGAMAVFAAVAWGVAQAEAPAVGSVVAVRQAGFGMMYGAWQNMRAGVAAKADPNNFVLAAQGIAAFGHQIPGLFPPGSGVGRTGFESIYKERTEFEKAAAMLAAAGVAVAKAGRAGDAAAFAASVKMLTESCAGCHTKKFADNWFK